MSRVAFHVFYSVRIFYLVFLRKVARDVLKDACQRLMLRCQHIRGTFDKAVDDFRTKNPPDDHPSQNMDSD
ncbi:hypothetical protein EUGRSUZ_G01031 [Eucalyptus grandis]|uniref:Uncharacterized protein n=3 Tax=Eucalyptus grandis TaxID=71139 RepID=A0A059BAZ5_EUCGR|nr:hypothetical protein EUGRSUZ_G01031 [Eucalyptus grandis]KAK3420215.1 hypothetical protein EUGRSUZ_G01031 [Eucalyptus grandis]